MLVCLCKGVSDKKVRAVIADGAQTTEAIGQACGAGTGCGACVPMLEGMLEAGSGELTAAQLVRKMAAPHDGDDATDHRHQDDDRGGQPAADHGSVRNT